MPDQEKLSIPSGMILTEDIIDLIGPKMIGHLIDKKIILDETVAEKKQNEVVAELSKKVSKLKKGKKK